MSHHAAPCASLLRGGGCAPRQRWCPPCVCLRRVCRPCGSASAPRQRSVAALTRAAGLRCSGRRRLAVGRRVAVCPPPACALSPPPPDTGSGRSRRGSGAGYPSGADAATPGGWGQPSTPTPPEPYGQPASLWTLFLLSTCYLHASACSYALPALLPDVAADLALDDGQAALLTTAVLLTYSVLLIPAGAAADTFDRPRLLALGALGGVRQREGALLEGRVPPHRPRLGLTVLVCFHLPLCGQPQA